MAAYIKLEDSPMFLKQIYGLEETADEVKDRSQKLYKGCKKYMASLEEACRGDSAFADALEAFGGGRDDPVSVSIGGPVMSKFIDAFRELATYKELLRSQVEHMLLDRLTHFLTVDLQEAKESRRRFDRSIHSYDQAREKFVSLKKNTRDDIVAELEEDLQNSKSAFEKSRFNLVNALMSVEAKKKFEFLESLSAIMDANLRYFKLGYNLLSQMEPFIHQVLTYTQQSKEQANIEQDRLAKRIQEFRTQSELENLRVSSDVGPTVSPDGHRVIGMTSYKNMEAAMQSTANGEVQTIKQGYLLKRSSSLRGDWKRRFFVLDRQGTLFYYRIKGTKPMGSHHNYSGSAEHNSGVFSRFRARHSRSASLTDENLGYRTVDLRTSTIKMDAEDTDLRLCFRIISPQKTYTLQAENGADRMDWVNKITAVSASLLNSQFLQQSPHRAKHFDKSYSGCGDTKDVHSPDQQNRGNDLRLNPTDSVITILRKIPGNDLCAECNAPDPDWASLNLGILLCIECSGGHRNLGVHISKVRSLTLDVKVWEPTILELFHALGNTYCNSIWEGLRLLEEDRVDIYTAQEALISKPCPKDSFFVKERFIHAKYVEKVLVIKDATVAGNLAHIKCIWEAVKSQNLQEIYRLIVTSETKIVNTTFDDVFGTDSYGHAADAQDTTVVRKTCDLATCQKIKNSSEPGNCLRGWSLLHVACNFSNPVLIELLLQFGADINMSDFHGRTPLHHCISMGNNKFAKLLLRRGARPSIRDGGGLNALERAMEIGAITDEELFILLSECQ